MELVTKLITIMGVIFTVSGLIWAFVGFFDFSAGRKNNDPTRQDQGLQSMILGGALAAISAGIAATIISQLGGIAF
ncbi:TPA: hypothetical protein ACGO5G_000443 [Streptococcus suis]